MDVDRRLVGGVGRGSSGAGSVSKEHLRTMGSGPRTTLDLTHVSLTTHVEAVKQSRTTEHTLYTSVIQLGHPRLASFCSFDPYSRP